MKVITDSKEIIKHIGDWPSVHIKVDYVRGAEEVVLQYEGDIVKYKSTAESVAYIVYQCKGMSAGEYDALWNELQDKK